MSSLLSDLEDEVPTMSPEDLRAYHAGRNAHAEGVRYDDGAAGDWQLGWLDSHDGVSVGERLSAEREGEGV